MSKWIKANKECEYVDFDKELYRLPDKGNTSVDIRLTFNTDMHTCYYTISLHNDDGNTRDWEMSHYIPWSVGKTMLAEDGVKFFQEESAK